MRIAHVINSIGLGGVPEAVHQMLRELVGGRHEHLLYVLRRPDADDAPRGERLARLLALGIDVAWTPEGAEKLAVTDRLASWLQTREIDVLHTHSYKPNIRGRLAGVLLKTRGLRLVAHYHNQYDANWARDGTLELDRLLTRQTDRVIACSDAVRAHVLDRLSPDPSRVVTIANGTDLARFSALPERQVARAALGFAGRSPAILLVGRISAQKGQEEAIAAMSAVVARFPDARLLLAGGIDEPERIAALERQAAASGVAGNVRFLGFVTEMPALYATADVLIAPSRWEGFGLMLVEALAAGVPIVATRVGAIPEVVGEAAVLVPGGDVDALAAAVIDVLASPSHAAELVARGRARARLFSWRRAADRLEAVYEELAGEVEGRRP